VLLRTPLKAAPVAGSDVIIVVLVEVVPNKPSLALLVDREVGSTTHVDAWCLLAHS
jgi:hypothetical protein